MFDGIIIFYGFHSTNFLNGICLSISVSGPCRIINLSNSKSHEKLNHGVDFAVYAR